MKNVISNPAQYLRPILYFCLSIIIFGLIAALLYASGKKSVMTAIEWILACLITGVFVGFQFRIPKTLQNSWAIPPVNGGTHATIFTSSNNYQQLANTNLTEISHLLIKIIVGLGLVKLTKFPPYIESLAVAFTQGLETKTQRILVCLWYYYLLCSYWLSIWLSIYPFICGLSCSRPEPIS